MPAVLPILSVICLLLGSMILLKIWQKNTHPHPEVARKWMHVLTGCIALLFPVLIPDMASVLVVCGLTIGLLLMQKFVRPLKSLGSVLNSVERQSLGDIYFLISIAVIYHLAPAPLYYIIPILVLTFADAFAALVGIYYGKQKYAVDNGTKSLEGSLAFGFTAFLATFLALHVYSDIGTLNQFLIAVLVSTVVTITEAVSWEGLDNLLIPYSTFIIISGNIKRSTEYIIYDIWGIVTLSLIGILLGKRSKFDISGILASILFGFIIYSIGGLIWILAPIFFYAFYVFAKSQQPHEHGVKYISIIVLPSILWMLYSIYGQTDYFYVYTVTIASQAATILGKYLRNFVLLISILPAFLILFYLPYFFSYPANISHMILFASCVSLSALFCFHHKPNGPQLHLLASALSLNSLWLVH